MVNVDLRVFGDDRGNYFHETERIIVYLKNHESLDDLYKTIQHELIHHAIAKCNITIDEDQEERAIFAMAWAEEYLL